jgi:GNAT superfamily N-acetyltransferase
VNAGCQYRDATTVDAHAIASLHAASWRRHYRGAYTDEFLDGDLVADRRILWTKRLTSDKNNSQTTLAEDNGAVVGFAYTILDSNPAWGALLDNLHVAAGRQRIGIGTELMARSAQFVVDQRSVSPLYLWVLEQNTRAQVFYEAIGGERVESALVPPVEGVPGRLNGTPRMFRYVWHAPSDLALLRR